MTWSQQDAASEDPNFTAIGIAEINVHFANCAAAKTIMFGQRMFGKCH